MYSTPEHILLCAHVHSYLSLGLFRPGCLIIPLFGLLRLKVLRLFLPYLLILPCKDAFLPPAACVSMVSLCICHPLP
jgi:hypothetical protein